MGDETDPDRDPELQRLLNQALDDHARPGAVVSAFLSKTTLPDIRPSATTPRRPST